jgi:hypothetical protein
MTKLQRTNIYLDEDQLDALKHLAVEDRRTVADIVRQAIDSYLARRLTDDAWRDRLDQLFERVQAHIPASISPEEIESDITAARAEVRRAHRAARRR